VGVAEERVGAGGRRGWLRRAWPVARVLAGGRRHGLVGGGVRRRRRSWVEDGSFFRYYIFIIDILVLLVG
jgi:hypothetical protein